MYISLVFALLLLVACQKTPSPEQDKPSQAPKGQFNLDAGTSVDAASAVSQASDRPADGGPPLEFVGRVRGVVKLAKGAKLPLAPFPQQNGITPPSVAPCPTIDASDQRNTVALAKQTGGLFPVHVALTGMTGVPKRQPVTHDIFIDACRMRPTMIAAMRGDIVRITNRTQTAMVPQIPGGTYMRGLMHGETYQAPLKQTRSVIDCSFGSFCGESLAIATTHPLASVTTPEGFFSIEHVPLDLDLKIYAWNPLFEVASAPFRLTHDKPEQMIELNLTPTAFAAQTRPGPIKQQLAPPKVIVKRVDGGIVIDSPGPGYE